MIGKYKIAALCVSRIHDDSTHELITELNKNITDKDYRLMVFHTCSDLYWDSSGEKGESSVFSLIDMRRVDVLIIADEKIKNKQLIKQLIERASLFDVPVIVIGGSYRGVINIGFDFRRGFEDVVRHMIEFHGFRHVHFMAGVQNNEFSEERIDVFRQVLEENGIEFDRESMVSYGDFWREPAAAATDRLLSRGDLPEAIICANDAMAVAVCETLMNAGVKVPEEVAVSGFDGLVDIYFNSPRITSSLCCYGDITRKIAGLLSMRKDDLLQEAHYQIKSRLMISESCGCDDSSLVNVSRHLTDLTSRFSRYKEEEKTLNEIGVRILSGRNLRAAANELHSPIIYNMRCMLRKEVIDETIDPFESEAPHDFGEELCVFFDSDGAMPFAPYDIPAKSVIPGLEVALEHGYPLLLTALNFLDVPLGYVVFMFQSYAINNYEKIPQIVNMLNNSIGGYRSLRYQRFIAEKIRELSECDQLTGLYTRGGSARAYENLVNKLNDQNRQITVIMTDLDGLKQINDNYGHTEGDFAIKATASALKNSCPSSSVCIRMGGDEMAAFASTSMSLEDLRLEIEARLRSISRTSGKPYPITASIGIYRSPANTPIPSFEELIRSADEIMYKDKAQRRKLRSAKAAVPEGGNDGNTTE